MILCILVGDACPSLSATARICPTTILYFPMPWATKQLKKPRPFFKVSSIFLLFESMFESVHYICCPVSETSLIPSATPCPTNFCANYFNLSATWTKKCYLVETFARNSKIVACLFCLWMSRTCWIAKNFSPNLMDQELAFPSPAVWLSLEIMARPRWFVTG